MTFQMYDILRIVLKNIPKAAAGTEYAGAPPCLQAITCRGIPVYRSTFSGQLFLRTAGRPYAFHVGMKRYAVTKIRIAPVSKMRMQGTLKCVLNLFRIWYRIRYIL